MISGASFHQKEHWTASAPLFLQLHLNSSEPRAPITVACKLHNRLWSARLAFKSGLPQLRNSSRLNEGLQFKHWPIQRLDTHTLRRPLGSLQAGQAAPKGGRHSAPVLPFGRHSGPSSSLSAAHCPRTSSGLVAPLGWLPIGGQSVADWWPMNNNHNHNWPPTSSFLATKRRSDASRWSPVCIHIAADDQLKGKGGQFAAECSQKSRHHLAARQAPRDEPHCRQSAVLTALCTLLATVHNANREHSSMSCNVAALLNCFLVCFLQSNWRPKRAKSRLVSRETSLQFS